MNKFVRFVLLAFTAVALAVGGWFLFLLYGPKLAIEDILPSGAVAYVRLAHPLERIRTGSQSAFWKNIAAIDAPAVLARNNVPKRKIVQFQYLQKEVNVFINNPVAQRFLGKEIAVAVYRHKNVDPLADPFKAYGILLVARPTVSVQAAEILSRLSSQWGDQINTTQERYKGQLIVHVQFKNKSQSIKYTHIKDLFVIAQEQEPAFDQVIDTYRDKAASLRQDELFKTAQSYLYPHAEGLAFVNMQDLIDAWSDPNEDNFNPASGLKTYTVSFLPGIVSKYKFIFGLEPDVMGPSLRNLIACAPKENSSVSFIPSGVIGYQWSGCYDFKEIAGQVKEQMQALPQFDVQVRKIKKGMEKRMGSRVSETLIPLLGDEAGGYLMDVDTQGSFVYPRLLAFIKVHDRVKVDELLKKFMKSPFGLVQEEQYGSSDIHYLSLALGSNMDPGYSFVGDYLLAATSRQLLKKSIDTYNDPSRSLKSDKTYTSLGLDTQDKAQTIAYFKVAEISKRLQGLLDWGNKLLSAQVTMATNYAQEGIEKKKDLEAELVPKKEELSLALNKLQEWQKSEDSPSKAQTIANFEQQVQGLQDEIRTNVAQQQQVDELMLEYKNKGANAKLIMFNSQQVLKPILKSLESINTQGVKVKTGPKVIETEFMIN